MLLPILLAACSPWPGGPTPMVEGDGFFDRPWPSDDRRIAGHPDLEGFPLQGRSELVDKMILEGELLDGFGLTSPIFLRTQGPIDPARLPSPAESLDPSNGLFLVDIDPTSHERGRTIPITWDVQDDETTWQPENLLAVQPVWGLPLRSATTYALVLTQAAWDEPRMPDGTWFSEVFHPDHPRFTEFEELGQTLFVMGAEVDSLAFATVFTTQDGVADMARIVHRMKEELPTHPLDQRLSYWWGNDRYQAWTGRVRVPIWQRGEAPYASEGGGFVVDDRGWPTLISLEEVGFTLSVPRSRAMPEDGWPVVVYSHGTGGSRNTFANSSRALEPASILAERGIVGLGISLPFHGDRYVGGSPEILSFNFLNPESGRTSFRQAALEQLWLTHTLTRGEHLLTGAGGAEIRLDPDRVAYMGHSHGAEIGIIAAPFFGPEVRAVVLSGAGGGLSISIIERDAGDFDIQELLVAALQFAPGEALDTWHPAAGLVQFVADATDPINYAPYWHAEEPHFDGTPAHVLSIHGLQDVHTPPSTVGALAAAARSPIAAPVGQTWLAQEFVPPGNLELPIEANARAWDGSRVTSAVLQYPEQDHFAIFQDPDAAAAYGDFLEAALADGPRIDRR